MKISDPQPSFKTLKADLAAFRAKCRPHARIPEHLRQAIISAVDSGIEPAIVKAELRVTSGQISIWRRRQQPRLVERPRVLDVIPTVLGTAEPSGLRVSYEAGRL